MLNFRRFTAALIALLTILPASMAVAQNEEPAKVGMIQIPEPRKFVDMHSKMNVQEALGQYIEAGRHQFVFVATRTNAYVKEIGPGDNVVTRRHKIEQIAERVKAAAKSPVTSDKYKEMVRNVQRRMQEKTAGDVDFVPTQIGVEHIPTTQPDAESNSESGSSSPPKVDEKPPTEITPTPVWDSVLGRSLLYFGVSIVALLLVGAFLVLRWRHRRRQLSADSPSENSRPDRSDTGRSSSGSNGSTEKRRRRSTTRSSSPSRGSSGDSPRDRRRWQRRDVGRKIGLLLATVILSLGFSYSAHAQDLVAVDVSGSSYDRSMADARSWLKQAVSNGETARVVAFGDSAWVVAERVETKAEVDSVLKVLDEIPPQSLTRLAGALRFIEKQAQLLRDRGAEPHVRITTDYDSDDDGNEAIQYIQFSSDSTVSPADTVAGRDSTNVQGQRAEGWWVGVGTGAGSILLLLGVVVGARRLRRDPDEEPNLDDKAAQVVDDEGRRDYTWREITQRGSLPVKEDDFVLAASEEDGDRIVLLGLGGVDPLEEETEDSQRVADGTRRRRREHRLRR